MNTKPIKIILKFLLLGAIVCFFFPFVTVSCASVHVEATGLDMMVGRSLRDLENSDLVQAPNPFLIGAFVHGVLGFSFSFARRRRSGTLVVAGVSGIMGVVYLVLFRISFLAFYELTDMMGMVDVEFNWPWTASLAMFLSGSVMAFMAFGMDGARPQGPAGMNVSAIEPTILMNQPYPPPEAPVPPERAVSRIRVTLYASNDLQNESVVIQSFPFRLGRASESSDLFLRDDRASRNHAVLLSDGAVYIQDMNSFNGTWVNGRRIEAPTEIRPGDEVIVGVTRIRLEIERF